MTKVKAYRYHRKIIVDGGSEKSMIEIAIKLLLNDWIKYQGYGRYVVYNPSFGSFFSHNPFDALVSPIKIKPKITSEEIIAQIKAKAEESEMKKATTEQIEIPEVVYDRIVQSAHLQRMLETDLKNILK